MKYSQLKQLKDKLYFTIDDVACIMDIKRQSAKVLCSRYFASGVFLRVKKNFYVLADNFEKYSGNDFMKLSNFIQVPSYISLTTALIKWDITSQVQVNTYEACCLKRSRENNAGDITFKYFKLSDSYYSGFIKKDGFFIAEKEKAFLDAVYLYSFGKYSLDFDALEVGRMDKKRLREFEKAYPDRTRKIIKKICRI